MTRCNHSEMAVQVDIENTKNSYYISIKANNKVGTIGLIGSTCAENNINLQSIIQKGIKEDDTAQIIVITEASLEKDMKKALEELSQKGIKINI